MRRTAYEIMKEGERHIDDLMFPRRKTLTDLWREKEERQMRKVKSTKKASSPFSDLSDSF